MGSPLPPSEALPIPPIPTVVPTYVYAGFWTRLGAAFIDGVIVAIIQLVVVAFGEPFVLPILINWLYYVLLTGLRGQTVGKMALKIKVVRGNGEVPGVGYAILREVIGKFISGLVLLLGYLWIIWDDRKQGWHDKMAGTFVVHT